MKDILMTTSDNISGYVIEKYYKIIDVQVIIGADFFSELLAQITDSFGGESKMYEGCLSEITKKAFDNFKLKVKKISDANAVIGINIVYNEIIGKGKQMFLVGLA